MNIQQLTLPEHKRILVTSDIHGHLTLLKKLLEKEKQRRQMAEAV